MARVLIPFKHNSITKYNIVLRLLDYKDIKVLDRNNVIGEWQEIVFNLHELCNSSKNKLNIFFF